MSLGSVRQEDETHPQYFYPGTEGTHDIQQIHLKYGKQLPESKACSDGILALNMHIMAKEISKHVQTLMTALRGDGHPI